MDTDPTVEMQLLAEAKKQTAAQESLRVIALMWSLIAALVAVTWLFMSVAAGR